MTKKAFTLIELLFAVVIIGILATLALPQFEKTKERALGKEAIANLKLIAAAEKIYYMENRAYYISGNVSNINSNLKLSLTQANWEYRIYTCLTGFCAAALRNGSGGYLNCAYELHYYPPDASDEEPWPSDPRYCP